MLSDATVPLAFPRFSTESGGWHRFGTRRDVRLRVPSAENPQQSANADRLLLVEDDRDALIAGAHLFEHAGFVVDIAKTASVAMVKAKAFRPAVIVTDLMMPGVGGEELVRRLRRRRATHGTPIIVYTAETDPHRLRPLLWLNVRVFAIKPCVPTAIAAEARQLLAGPDARDLRVVTGYGESLEELAAQLRDILEAGGDPQRLRRDGSRRNPVSSG
jgi:DNA-binding response OmpR family regulator